MAGGYQVSTDLAVRAPDNGVAAFELDQRRAKAYAESGYWPDTKSMAQAFVKIEAGRALGIPAMLAMTDIHIIEQKPQVGAGALAALVKAHPKYDYRVLELTNTVCRIRFYEHGEPAGPDSTFDESDAKKAKLSGKKNYQEYPRNMLFARAMSNGAAWYCPDVTMGRIYIPEDFGELGGVPGAEGAAEGMGPPTPPNPDPGGAAPPSPADEGVLGEGSTAPEDEPRPDQPTLQQRKKLDATVGQMRRDGQITTAQVAELAGIHPTLCTDPNGEIHWSTIRHMLNRQQASDLISELGYWAYKHPPPDDPSGQATFEIPETAKK